MKYIVILLLTFSCINKPKENKKDIDYFIQVFGKSYICEDFKPNTKLVKCINVLDSSDKIEKIIFPVNFIEVGDLV